MKNLLKEMPWGIKLVVSSCIFLGIIFVLFSLYGCSSYPDDNFVEEAIEEKIMEKTGINLDFTGHSEED